MYLCLCVSLSHFVSVSFRLLTSCQWFSVIPVPLKAAAALIPPLSLSFSLSDLLSLSLSLSLSLFLSLSELLSLRLSPSQSLSLSLSLSLIFGVLKTELINALKTGASGA